MIATMFVLIMTVTGTSGTIAIHTQEFYTEKTCKIAGEEWAKNQYHLFREFRYQCVEK